jgi:phage shock protein PspC (stress-responsive transcriptional regulator)
VEIEMKKLYKSESNRVIAGVCGVLLYLIAVVVMPKSELAGS